jgi:hypothetical protein
MLPFKRSYNFSAALLSVLALIPVIGSVVSEKFGSGSTMVPLVFAAVALFPIFWRGGILANPRLSIGIAGLLTLATGIAVGLAFLDFVRIRSGRTTIIPHGSPIPEMIALAFGAVIFFCPWLLTTLRGLRHWNTRNSA